MVYDKYAEFWKLLLILEVKFFTTEFIGLSYYSTAQVQGNVRTRLKRVLTASETRLARVWDSGRTRLGRVPETRLTSSLLCTFR